MLSFFFESADVLFALIPIGFFVIFVGIMFAVVGKYTKSNYDSTTNSSSDSTTTSDQDYIEKLKQQRLQALAKQKSQAEQSDVAQTIDQHNHVGKVEKYDKIVGSLGEVNDEGCDELDGVRLVDDDQLYQDTDQTDEQESQYASYVHAMVIGDALNNPRFKSRYKRK